MNLRKIFRFFPIVSVLMTGLFLFSCTEKRFPDFSESVNGLLYKLVDIGDSDKKPKIGDYVTVQMTIQSEKDSMLYDSRIIGLDGSVTFILEKSPFQKDYREGFLSMSEGDSAIFLTDAYSFYMKKNNMPVPAGMKMESIIRINVRLLNVATPEEHQLAMQKEKEMLEKGEFEEKKVLDQFMADSNIAAQMISNGIYYIRMVEGQGLSPDSGSIALLNYKGCFLNGRCFDNTWESQPFEYVIGAEDQLIKGLEIGVKRMHEGEKAKFIIPSHLAYGNAGSANGIVPPFTTIIYEVELIKVQ